jgi:phage terminase large subunit-like protein
MPLQLKKRCAFRGCPNTTRNPVLRWMAGNVSIEKDAADNWKPSKKKSRERIDGIVALIMALERATAYQESVYNTRGALFITLDDDWDEAGE